MDAASGSIARSNRRQDRGSPWRTPLVTWYGVLLTLFMVTDVWAFLYSAATVSVNISGRRKAFSVSIR